MLPGVSFSQIDAARIGGERGLRGALEGLEVQPGLAGWAPEHSWIMESSRTGWRLSCPSELWALSFNPHTPKNTEGSRPWQRRCWSCQELELPWDLGDSIGCHLLCPRATAPV